MRYTYGEHNQTSCGEYGVKKILKKTQERQETHETRIVVLGILLSFFTLRKGMKKIKNFSETHETHKSVRVTFLP